MSQEEKSPVYKYKSLQKPGRFMTLFCGKVIYGGDYFESTDENIPKGFRDLIKMVPKAEEKKKVITPLKRTKKVVNPVVEKPTVVIPEEDENLDDVITEEQKAEIAKQEEKVAEEKREAEAEDTKPKDPAKGLYTMKHIARGRYQVYNAAGDEQSDKMLLEQPAKLLMDQLNTAE